MIMAFNVCGPPHFEREKPPKIMPNVGADTQVKVNAIDTKFSSVFRTIFK